MIDTVREFFAYSLPWWLWIIPIPAILFALFIFVKNTFGLRMALSATGAAILAFLTLTSHQRGRQQGWRDRQLKEERDAKSLVDRVDKVRKSVRERNADPSRLRDDDGFKRKP